MVNITTANVFNGVFETRKLTEKRKIFAQSGVKNAWRSAVYHAGINHDRPLRGLYFSFIAGRRAGRFTPQAAGVPMAASGQVRKRPRAGI